MNELCRLCGERNENGTSIFDESSKNHQIASKIHQILGIKVSEEDVLPTCVCATCRGSLDYVTSFVDSCRKVQERLKILHDNFTRKEHEFIDNDGFKIECPSDNKRTSYSESNEKNDVEMISLSLENTNDISSEKSKIRNLPEETPSRSSVVKLPRWSKKARQEDTSSDVTVKSSNFESRKSGRISKSVKFPTETDRADISTKRVTRSTSSSFPSSSQVRVRKMESSDFEDSDDVSISDDNDYSISDDNDIGISDDNDSDYEYKPSTIKLKISSSQDNEKPTKSSLKIKSNVSYEKMTCNVCKQKFNNEFVLAEHMNLHTGNRPFKCRLCEKTFRIRKELNAHLRTVHSDKEFPCPLCDYVCKYRGKLTEHVKNLHEKPFSCAICDYRTGLKCKLAEHIAHRHKEFTPVANEMASFVCEICGTSLKSKKSLQSHRINMHFPEPKQCQTCGVMFPSGARYKGHLQTCGRERKRYPCDECGCSYAYKASLEDHMNKHRDLRPYKCDICERAFRTRTHLDSHKFVHRGPLFHCEICGQRFNRKDNMNVHVRKHYANPDPNLMVLAT